MRLHLPRPLRKALLACISVVSGFSATVTTGTIAAGSVVCILSSGYALANVTATQTADSLSIAGGTAFSTTANIVSGNGLDSEPIGTGGGYPTDEFDYTVLTGNGRYKIAGPLEKGGTIVVASGLYGSDSTAFTGGQLMVGDWGRPGAVEVTNDLILGASNYTEGNFSGALRLSGEVAGHGVYLKGGITVVEDTRWSVGASYNYIEGAVDATAGKVTITGYASSSLPGTLNFSGGGTFSALSQGATIINLNKTHNDGTAAAKTDYYLGSQEAATGVINVNEGTTLSLTGGTVAGNIGGVGTLKITGEVTLDGTYTMHSAIVNEGAVTLGSNVKFDLDLLTAGENGVYTLFTGTNVDLSSLTSANVLNPILGYTYTFNTDGTLRAAMTSQSLTWNGGSLTWQDGAVFADNKTFSAGDIVTFSTADATVELGADISAAVIVDRGVTVTLGGAHTLTSDSVEVNGTLDLGDATLAASSITVAGELVLHGAENLSAGTGAISSSGNTAKVTVAGGSVTFNGLPSFRGTVHVAEGGTAVMWANGNNPSTCFGSIDNTILVDKGGVLDVKGCKDHLYTVTLNGGILQNTGSAVPSTAKQFKGLVLRADSTIGGTGRFGIINTGYGATTVALDTYTLTKTGSNIVDFINTTFTGGMVHVKEGQLRFDRCTLSTDLILSGGSIEVNNNITLTGDRTITGLSGGSITGAVVANGSLMVDVAQGATLNMTALSTTSFSKAGEGALTLSGQLSVSRLLSMNYAGTLDLNGGISVSDGAVLSYGGGDSLLSLTSEQLAGSVIVDIFGLDLSQLQSGVNLGLSQDIDQDKISVGGLTAADYSIIEKDGQLWLTATKVAETDWDSNWATADLSKAPAELTSATISASTGLVYDNSPYDNGTRTAILLSGSEGTGLMVFGGASSEPPGSNSIGTITRDTWVKAEAGTYNIVAGGNYCNNWSGGTALGLIGNTHVLIDGATVGFVIGGNVKDGKAPVLTGDTYVTVQGDSTVSSVFGAGTTAHSSTNTLVGSTHVFIYTPLGNADFSRDSLPKNVLAGGGAWQANNTAGTVKVTGDTNLTIDLSQYSGDATSLTKAVTAGSYMERGTSNIGGDTNLVINAEGYTLSGRVSGGGILSSGSNAASMLIGGDVNMKVTGGTISAYSGAGAFLNGVSTVTIGGTVNMTVTGGTFNERYAAGVFQNTAKAVTVSIGGLNTQLLGGTFIGHSDFAFTGGSAIYGNGSVAANLTHGDINLVLDGATIQKKLYGGSFNTSGHTAGTFTHGDITVSLLSGSLQGDFYAAGSGGSVTMVANSTTVELGDSIQLTQGKVISGGYESATNSTTVTGDRKLVFNTSGTQDISSSVLKDFDVISVKEATAAVTIGTITETMSSAVSLTKEGAGTLNLATGQTAQMLAVRDGKVVLSGDCTITSTVVDSGAVLDLGSCGALNGALTLSDGAVLGAVSGGSGVSVSSLTLGSGLALQISGDIAEDTRRIALFSGLSESTIQGLTFVEEDGFKFASIDGILSVSGVSSEFNRLLLENGVLSLVNGNAAAAELFWNGGTGTWDSSSALWGSEGGDNSSGLTYEDKADVTISGSEGGTITVSGDLKATNVTFAHSGYTLAAGEGASLSISGKLTVAENVTATLNFLPTVKGGYVVNDGAVLDMSAISSLYNSSNRLAEFINSAQGNGTVKLAGADTISDSNRLMLGSDATLAVNLDISQSVAINSWNAAGNAVSLVLDEKEMNIAGELRLESSTKIVVDGGSLSAGSIALGHQEGGQSVSLELSSGTITAGSISATNDTDVSRSFNMSGGDLKLTADGTISGVSTTITGGRLLATEASWGIEDATVGAEGSTVTITTSGDHTLTLSGGTLAGTITNEGSLTLSGTVGGSTAVVNGGKVTVSDGADVSLSQISGSEVTGSGALTLEGAGSSVSSLTLGSLSMGTSASVAVQGAMDLDSLTLGRLDKETGYLSAGSLSGDLAVWVNESILDGLALSTGGTAVIATLGAEYAGSLTLNSDTNSTFSSDTSGYRYTISVDDSNRIIVTATLDGNGWVGSADQVWGSDASAWEENSTPGEGDIATFTGGGSSEVHVAESGVTVKTVAVESPDKDYTFVGGNVTTSSLTISDGSLTIGNTTTATATSVAADCELTVAENGVLNAGNITVNTGAALTNNGTVSVSGGSIAILNGTGSLSHTSGNLVIENMGASASIDSLTNAGTLTIGSAVTIGQLQNSSNLTVQGDLVLTGSTANGGDVKAESVSLAAGNNTFATLTTNNIILSTLPGVNSDAALTVDSLEQYLSAAAEGDVLPITLGIADLGEISSLSSGEYVLVSSKSALDSLLGLDSEIRNQLAAHFKVSTSYGEDNNQFILNLDVLSKGDLVWMTSKGTTEAGAEVVLSGANAYTGLDQVLMVDANASTVIDLTQATPTTEEGLVIRNLTQSVPDSSVTISIKGNDDAVVTLANTVEEGLTDSQVTASLVNLDITKTKVNVGLSPEDGTDLTVGDVQLTDSQLSIGSAASLSVGKLDGSASSALSGAVTVSGSGGNYAGSYENATVVLAANAHQILAAGSGLTIAGSAGTAEVDMTHSQELTSIQTTGASVVVGGDVSQSSLKLAESSSMVGGSLTLGVSVPNLGATTQLVEGSLSLDGTQVIINQLDSATYADFGSGMTVVLGMIGDADTTSVTLNGPLFNKYFKNAFVQDGKLVGERNTAYFSDMVSESDPNAAAGAAMLDEALLACNPQVTSPDGALSSIMSALENGTADAEKLTSSVAGSGLASISMALSSDMDRQLRAIRNRTTTMGVDQQQVSENMPYFNAWVNAEGDYRKMDAEGAKAGFDLNSWGGTMGFDVDVTPELTMGLALTAMYGDFESTLNDRVEGDIDTYYVSLFGRYARHRWTHTAVVALGISDLSLDRTVSYNGGSSKTTGDTSGLSFGAMYEVGYVVPLNEEKTACLQPVFNVTFRHVGVSGYTETGSDAALRVDDIEADVVTFGVGARVQAAVGENLYNRSALFEGRTLLKVDAGDTAGEVSTALSSIDGRSHAVKGADMGKVGVELGAGLTIPTGAEGGALFFDGSAELRSGYTNLNATVGYRINF